LISRTASKLYPPRSNNDLKTLHNSIVNSSALDHHKQSLVYYILKDLAQPNYRAENFAKSFYLPSRYQIFIDGIWHLDRLKLEKALDYLTSPSLIPTFLDAILYALCRHAPPHDPTLPLAYYHTVSPPLTSPKVLSAFFDRFCAASLTEAFFFARSQGSFRHRHLFEQLITFVVNSSKGEIRGNRAVELIGLPFNEEEEEWFEDFLTEGKGKELHEARDTLMVRKVVKGEIQDAVELGKKLSGKKMDGVNWTSLTHGLQHGAKLYGA
jgi:hypothetical protein